MGPRPGCSGLCPERKRSPQRSGGGHTSIATMVTTCAVTLVMVAVVLLGNGLIPPKWRGGACLMAGVCPGPENSPDPIGVPVNPGGGLTAEREGWAPGRREIPGREMLNWSGKPGGPAISTSL